jgi:hypothetical protein
MTSQSPMTETASASRKKASPAQLALVGVLSVVLIAVLAFRMSPRSSATTTEPATAKPLAAAEVSNGPASATAAATPSLEAAQSIREPVTVDVAQLGRTNPFRGLVDGSVASRGNDSEPGESATLAASENAADSSAENPDESTVLALAEGVGNLRVSAILGSGQNRVALIGDKVVRPGDLLDERLQVVAIHNDRVEIAAATESE